MTARGRTLLVLLAALISLLAVPPLAQAAAPANDNFVNAEMLPGPAATVSATNNGATKEPGEPNHAGSSGWRSVWYRWVAPANATAVLELGGASTTADPALAVYTGLSVNALSKVASARYVPG